LLLPLPPVRVSGAKIPGGGGAGRGGMFPCLATGIQSSASSTDHTPIASTSNAEAMRKKPMSLSIEVWFSSHAALVQ
jgi:hypothetical protein